MCLPKNLQDLLGGVLSVDTTIINANTNENCMCSKIGRVCM